MSRVSVQIIIYQFSFVSLDEFTIAAYLDDIGFQICLADTNSDIQDHLVDCGSGRQLRMYLHDKSSDAIRYH